MPLSRSITRRVLAAGTASVIGLGALLIASPAAADSTEDAPTVGAPYAALAIDLLESDPAIQAVGKGEDGQLMVVAVAGSDEVKAQIEAQYANAEVQFIPAELDSYATTDIVGGAGYFASPQIDSSSGQLCSFGFGAWTPTGGDAIVSAGHCAFEGGNSYVQSTVPTGDAAGGSTTGTARQHYVGRFGFYRFGGAGNSVGADGDPGSVDFAAIDVLNPAITITPEITDWTTASSNDLSQSTTQITAVGTAAVGQSVSKSGRTTGLTTLAHVGIAEGWANIGGHFVYGFGGDGAFSDFGDSGGAVFSGTTALGVISGGLLPSGDFPGFEWIADLKAGLALSGGYTVKLFLEAPVVVTPGGSNIERGAAVTGTGPASTEIVVTPASGAAFTVQSDAAGVWTFAAPSTLGAYGFTVQAQDGFNLSEVTSSSVVVVPAPLAAPVITSPADGSVVNSAVTTLSGTGAPGAVVTVTGAATGTATVTGGGTFSVVLSSPLSYGAHSLSVTQSSEGVSSPAATTNFTVAPLAPAITSPASDSHFDLADAPTSVSGTGIEGATVSIMIDGVIAGDAEVVGGEWTYPFTEALSAGAHSVTASQVVNGVKSTVATVHFTVDAPAVVDPPSTPAGNGGGGSDGLAKTGAESLGALGGAVALLLAGGLVLAIRRRSTVAGSELS